MIKKQCSFHNYRGRELVLSIHGITLPCGAANFSKDSSVMFSVIDL